MKYTLLHLSAIAGLAMLLTSCNEVKDDERWLPAPVNPVRTVLVEEYTGQRCTNCPSGHRRLKEFEELYNTPENLQNGIGVISVGIHIPGWGSTIDNGGLITPEAEALSGGQSSAPYARINRNTDPLALDNWASAINNEISRRPPIQITPLLLEYDDTADKLSVVSGSIRSDEIITGAKLHVWLVQDNFIAAQMDNGTVIRDYDHHAIYRASFTGISGRDIEIPDHEDIEIADFGLSHPVDVRWTNNQNNRTFRAIAFVELPGQGVLNAAQSPTLELK